MAIGQRGFHRYLKQQRAMGRSEPTREDKAAYLQGDIQAQLAMANQQRQTGIQERAQRAQEGQFAQTLAQQRKEAKTAKKQWGQEFALQEDQAKKQERWNKLRGISEIAKLGIEAAPYLKSAGQWAYGQMGGGQEYDPGYSYDPGYDFDRDYDIGGGDYGYEPDYEVPQFNYDTQYDIQGGNYYQPPPTTSDYYSQFGLDDSSSGWFDF